MNKYYIDSFFINTSLNLPVESIGRIIKNLIHNEKNQLNKEEEILFNYLLTVNKDRFIKRQKASQNTWKKIKEEKQEKTQKGDLQKREITQKQYNKPFSSVTNKNNKSTFTNDYLKTGVIKL